MSRVRYSNLTEADPIPAELVIRRDNLRPEGERPRALDALNSPRLVHAPGSDSAPGIERLTESGTWRMDGKGASREIPGDAMELLETPEPVKDQLSAESKPAPWAGTEFHPRISPQTQAAVLHRRRGTKAKGDHTLWGGVDDRITFWPTGYPWHCVGRLSVSATYNVFGITFTQGWSGSGALVGNSVVLTASHVVPWGASSWSCTFTPASYDGSSTLGSTVFSWVRSARGYSDHGQGDDMAIMRLWDPLGESLGYFGAKTYHDSWEGTGYWTLVGYHGDLSSGNRPSYQSGIVVDDDDSDGAGVELEHTGDRFGGSSGGPLFGWWSNGPHVVGTHSGEEDNFFEGHNHVAAGGSALVNLISDGRNDWD